MVIKLGAAVLAIAFLAACGKPSELGLSTGQNAPVTVPAMAVRGGRTGVVLHLVVPRRHHRRDAHYISPATKSLAITIVSASGVTSKHDVDLTPASNPNCTKTGCTIAFAAAAGRYTYAFAAFDGLLGPTGNPTGHELSAALKIPVTIRAGRQNVIGVTLDGIPASVALVPSPSSDLTGSGQAYALSKCYSHTANQQSQSVSVLGIDADKNFILGAGAPAASLASGDSVHLAASPASPVNTASFLLSDPTGVLPSPHSVVQLTATVTPAAASGGTPITQLFTVTFDASICGVFTAFPLPAPSSLPIGITNGPDGALWFTEYGANKIGRISTTGAITEIATTGVPYSIAAGPQNTMWFTQCGSNQIGQVATSGGTVYEYHVPTASSGLFNIVSDPHGGFPWFTETDGKQRGYAPSFRIRDLRRSRNGGADEFRASVRDNGGAGWSNVVHRRNRKQYRPYRRCNGHRVPDPNEREPPGADRGRTGR